ncbi:MAG TPA: histidine kinase dimerization/phospho-acceptor domain-containing protein, partial [Chloroflexota bacterium]|nr:histidine kinase dimerization/phospho-acceptor domain-containing protein [Chloroflexota bacterium]
MGTEWSKDPGGDRGPNAHFDLRPLRLSILRILSLLALTGALLWSLWIPDPAYPLTFLPAGTSVLILGWAFVAAKRIYLLGVWLFLIGVTVFPAGSVWASPGSLGSTFFGPIVLVAGIFLGPGYDLIVGLLLSGIVIFGWLGPGQPISEPVALTSLGLIKMCALLSYVASRPLYTALDWSWYSFTQAREKMDDARERQFELGRVSKSLQESYVKLEHMSRELERARKAAEDARRLKSEFAANISHELRTPLNLIVGFSEMMIMAPHAYEGDTLPASYRGDVTAIHRSVRHLSGLIDDVLDLSQIEAGRMGLNKEWVTLQDVIQESTGMVDALFQSKGLYLNIDIPDP